MTEGHDDDHHGGDHHGHNHGEDGHGHHHDRGLKGILRYARHAPRLWTNEANDYVIATIAPQRGERVLDIGSGMGPGAMAAAQRGAEVVAVDPTPFLRNVLRLRRVLRGQRRSITVMDGSAEQLPVADGSIAAVWAVNAMHHWQDIEAAASEIHRVLAPGGRVLLVDEDFDHPEHEFSSEESTSYRHEHDLAPVAAVEMVAALGKAGLVDTEAEELLIPGGIPVHQATARKA